MLPVLGTNRGNQNACLARAMGSKSWLPRTVFSTASRRYNAKRPVSVAHYRSCPWVWCMSVPPCGGLAGPRPSRRAAITFLVSVLVLRLGITRWQYNLIVDRIQKTRTAFTRRIDITMLGSTGVSFGATSILGLVQPGRRRTTRLRGLSCHFNGKDRSGLWQ